MRGEAVDGQQKPFDSVTWLVRFTHGRAKSKWSRVNLARAEELFAGGRVRAVGMVGIERAKADVRRDAAYPAASQATVPEDLQTAFDATAAARRFF